MCTIFLPFSSISMIIPYTTKEVLAQYAHILCEEHDTSSAIPFSSLPFLVQMTA